MPRRPVLTYWRKLRPDITSKAGDVICESRLEPEAVAQIRNYAVADYNEFPNGQSGYGFTVDGLAGAKLHKIMEDTRASILGIARRDVTMSAWRRCSNEQWKEWQQKDYRYRHRNPIMVFFDDWDRQTINMNRRLDVLARQQQIAVFKLPMNPIYSRPLPLP